MPTHVTLLARVVSTASLSLLATTVNVSAEPVTANDVNRPTVTFAFTDRVEVPPGVIPFCKVRPNCPA